MTTRRSCSSHGTAVLALMLVSAGCARHESASTASQGDPSPGAGVGDGGGIRIHFPGPVRPPAPLSPGAGETDVPLAWIFLPEDPTPTGAAPDAVVGAVVPCGYRPAYGTVSAPVSPLLLRLHAVSAPADPACRDGITTAQRISLQRLRLGDFDVSDAVPRGASDGVAPRARLRVVGDEPSALPLPAARRVRGCAVGDDASCSAGGVCAQALDARRGVCVPPMDPLLAAGVSCAPGDVAVSLRHGVYSVRAAPPPGELRACLPECGEGGACGAGLSCVQLGATSACVPRP